jgi:dUTP pyrophosphatase
MPSNSVLYIKADDSVKIFYTEHSIFHEGDSGLDLFFPEDVVINPGEVKKVDLGISCEMIEDMDKNHVYLDTSGLYNPVNEKKNVSYYLYARSSIANTPLMMANSVGIVDAAYRGNLKAALRNVGTEPYMVKRGERLVQICTGDLKPFNFKLVDTLSDTSRGSGGFGSTGK